MRIFLGDNCMKGGMSCERKCSFEMSPPECTEVSIFTFLKRLKTQFKVTLHFKIEIPGFE